MNYNASPFVGKCDILCIADNGSELAALYWLLISDRADEPTANIPVSSSGLYNPCIARESEEKFNDLLTFSKLPLPQFICRFKRVRVPLIATPFCCSPWIVSEVVYIFLVPSQAPLQEQWKIDREYWDAQLEEPWYLNQVEEPENDVGKSILDRWLDPLEAKDEKGWRCRFPKPGETWCNETIKRFDRAIVHVRGHLNLKPYPCEGDCNKPNWYAKRLLSLTILTP